MLRWGHDFLPSNKPAPTLYEYILQERKLVEDVGVKADLFMKNPRA